MKTTSLIRFRIDFAQDSNIGPGKIELLEAISKHGSVSAAGRAMQMSYRRAWLLLESLNQTFTERVSVNSVGGIGGGGVEITPFGTLLIKSYREIEQRFAVLADEHLAEIKARIKPRRPNVTHRVPIAKSVGRRAPAKASVKR